MSFRREVLEQIRPLEDLYMLYDKRVARGEDGVLSHMAARYGRLLMLTENLDLFVRNPSPAWGKVGIM